MSGGPASHLVCAGCENAPPDDAPFPFRCLNAGRADDIDHVLVRRLVRPHLPPVPDDERNPFVRFRTLLHSHARALGGGMRDAAFVALVRELDARVAAVSGCGFRETPFRRFDTLAARAGAGALWIKDETRHVAGSHKARHLFGVLLHLEVSERLGLVSRAESDRRGLAIASCGNAALAAAVIARATSRPLEVFTPPDADRGVVARLESLGARITSSPRRAGERGDPCIHAFHRALERGALPFCCQGNENGLTIEGGETLAWEVARTLAAADAGIDRLFVQVGGGALASACIQGLREAVALGALPHMPRVHAVQTRGAFPLRRAYERVRAIVLERLGGGGDGGDASAAERMRAPAAAEAAREALRYARHHRSEFMWPWEEPPRSIAHGILDDETYDWHAVIEGMIETGGWPVTVTEERLAEAHALARACTDLAPDHTGAAGLAGLLELGCAGAGFESGRVAVLFTGAERGS